MNYDILKCITDKDFYLKTLSEYTASKTDDFSRVFSAVNEVCDFDVNVNSNLDDFIVQVADNNGISLESQVCINGAYVDIRELLTKFAISVEHDSDVDLVTVTDFMIRQGSGIPSTGSCSINGIEYWPVCYSSDTSQLILSLEPTDFSQQSNLVFPNVSINDIDFSNANINTDTMFVRDIISAKTATNDMIGVKLVPNDVLNAIKDTMVSASATSAAIFAQMKNTVSDKLSTFTSRMSDIITVDSNVAKDTISHFKTMLSSELNNIDFLDNITGTINLRAIADSDDPRDAYENSNIMKYTGASPMSALSFNGLRNATISTGKVLNAACEKVFNVVRAGLIKLYKWLNTNIHETFVDPYDITKISDSQSYTVDGFYYDVKIPNCVDQLQEIGEWDNIKSKQVYLRTIFAEHLFKFGDTKTRVISKYRTVRPDIIYGFLRLMTTPRYQTVTVTFDMPQTTVEDLVDLWTKFINAYDDIYLDTNALEKDMYLSLVLSHALEDYFVSAACNIGAEEDKLVHIGGQESSDASSGFATYEFDPLSSGLKVGDKFTFGGETVTISGVDGEYYSIVCKIGGQIAMNSGFDIVLKASQYNQVPQYQIVLPSDYSNYSGINSITNRDFIAAACGLRDGFLNNTMDKLVAVYGNGTFKDDMNAGSINVSTFGQQIPVNSHNPYINQAGDGIELARAANYINSENENQLINFWDPSTDELKTTWAKYANYAGRMFNAGSLDQNFTRATYVGYSDTSDGAGTGSEKLIDDFNYQSLSTGWIKFSARNKRCNEMWPKLGLKFCNEVGLGVMIFLDLQSNTSEVQPGDVKENIITISNSDRTLFKFGIVSLLGGLPDWNTVQYVDVPDGTFTTNLAYQLDDPHERLLTSVHNDDNNMWNAYIRVKHVNKYYDTGGSSVEFTLEVAHWTSDGWIFHQPSTLVYNCMAQATTIQPMLASFVSYGVSDGVLAYNTYDIEKLPEYYFDTYPRGLVVGPYLTSNGIKQGDITHETSMFHLYSTYVQHLVNRHANPLEYEYYPYSYSEGFMQPRFSLKTDEHNTDVASKVIAAIAVVVLVATAIIVGIVISKKIKTARYMKYTRLVGAYDNAIWNGTFKAKDTKKYIKAQKKLRKMDYFGDGLIASSTEEFFSDSDANSLDAINSIKKRLG